MDLTEVNQGEPCVHSSNVSSAGTSPTLTDALLYTCVAAIVLETMCGNVLVIISISHFKQLHTPTNLFLLSLAAADLLIGMAVMPFHFILLIDPFRALGAMHCTISNVFSCYMTCVSIYSVAFIAVDRYFSLCKPFLYSSKMTVNFTLKIISILWLYSLIYNVAFLYFNGIITDLKKNIVFSECIVVINAIWATVDFLIVFLVPCATIIIVYLKIFAIVKMHAHKIRCVRQQHDSNGTKMYNYSTASERKAAKILGILVSVFLLCLVPYFISVLIDVYMRKPSVYLAVINTLTLMYLNSSINPIIYALFYPWFQKSAKLILTFRICGSDSSLLNVFAKETKKIHCTS